MTFRLRFPTLFEGLFAAAQIRHASYWGECAHCAQAIDPRLTLFGLGEPDLEMIEGS